MEHVIFADGNTKHISWVIQTKDSTVEQTREHHEIYLDKINSEESKYIAYHVGLFWGLGNFIIKDADVLNVKIDSKSMYDDLINNNTNSDGVIEEKIWFINELIEQRKLKINYELIKPNDNLASKILEK